MPTAIAVSPSAYWIRVPLHAYPNSILLTWTAALEGRLRDLEPADRRGAPTARFVVHTDAVQFSAESEDEAVAGVELIDRLIAETNTDHAEEAAHVLRSSARCEAVRHARSVRLTAINSVLADRFGTTPVIA